MHRRTSLKRLCLNFYAFGSEVDLSWRKKEAARRCPAARKVCPRCAGGYRRRKPDLLIGSSSVLERGALLNSRSLNVREKTKPAYPAMAKIC